MVNTGKPSGGCLKCKQRKVKCDERRPHCLRCEKINHCCPGVPDSAPKEFSSSRRVLKSLKRARSSASSSVTSSSPSTTWHSKSSTSSPLTPSLSPLVETQGIALFFNHYVLTPRNQKLQNFMSCLAPVYNSCNLSSPLRFAVAANAASTLSGYLGQREIQGTAMWNYGRALEQLRLVLMDEEVVVKDDTLMAVLMLMLFENQSTSDDSITCYSNHTQAIVALTVRRGTSQLSNPQSLKLFRTIRTYLFLSSVQSATSPSLFYSGFDWFADARYDDETPEVSTLMEAAFSIPYLRDNAMNLFSEISSPNSTPPPSSSSAYSSDNSSATALLLTEALTTDARLTSWHANLPSSWLPIPTRASPSPAFSSPSSSRRSSNLASPNPISGYSYTCPLAATMLNHYHVFRLLTLGIARHCLSSSMIPPSPQNQLKETQLRIEIAQCVEEICASVAWFLGDWGFASAVSGSGGVDDEEVQTYSGLDDYDFAHGPGGAEIQDDNAADTSGAYYLIWPLFVAMSVDCIADAQRRWIRGVLVDISREYGYAQAEVFAGCCC